MSVFSLHLEILNSVYLGSKLPKRRSCHWRCQSRDWSYPFYCSPYVFILYILIIFSKESKSVSIRVERDGYTNIQIFSGILNPHIAFSFFFGRYS